MPVPLTLGVPPSRDEHPLTTALLLPAPESARVESPLVGALRSEVVYATRPVDAAQVVGLVAAGRVAGLDLGVSGDEVANFLAVLAHADTGFVARARSADDVLAVLAATVAALRGDDVRSAWRHPDVAALAALRPAAASAVREVLLGVEVTDVAGIVARLAVLDRRS